MLRRDSSEATSYWLQLLVSIGIATLGLVVGSAAVIIGAMLVAPLMGPIVALGMGVASGSPFLVLRASGRISMSVATVIGGAALITLTLPYHEINSEIAARTSPTLLDLVTAAFCALAGVYATVRSGSDTATTAAGTSIGISLVPPLCVSGWGLGTLSGPVAGGAALLFLTNLAAIVVVSAASFVIFGFNRVDVISLEREVLAETGEEAPVARAVATRLQRLFESRWGPAMRFLMPAVLLAGVFVPLRQALDEVSWAVQTRSQVLDLVSRESLRVLERSLRVERHEVDLFVVVLGTPREAEEARIRLDAEVRRISGVVPRIEVLAVADAGMVAGIESSLRHSRTADAPPVTVALSPVQQLEQARARVHDLVSELWPADTAGAPLSAELDTAPVGPIRLRVTHMGPPLAPDAREALRRAASEELGRNVLFLDVALPPAPISRGDDDLAFVAALAATLARSSDSDGIAVCLTRPPDSTPAASPGSPVPAGPDGATGAAGAPPSTADEPASDAMQAQSAEGAAIGPLDGSGDAMGSGADALPAPALDPIEPAIRDLIAAHAILQVGVGAEWAFRVSTVPCEFDRPPSRVDPGGSAHPLQEAGGAEAEAVPDSPPDGAGSGTP